jgi:hypothetical protein
MQDKCTALSEFAERAVFLVKGAAVAGICAELLTVPGLMSAVLAAPDERANLREQSNQAVPADSMQIFLI